MSESGGDIISVRGGDFVGIRTQNREIDLFIYGHIDYTDVFGDQQHTYFCWQYAGERQGEAVLHRLRMYGRHNDAT